MNKLALFKNSDRKKLVSKRSGESKFGEHVQLLSNSDNIYEQLLNLDVEYVVFGIPEDVGVFANGGKSGTYSAWDATIKFLLNTQSNQHTHAKKVAILGYLDFSTEQKAISNLQSGKKKDLMTARALVETIDAHVSLLVHDIVKAGKKPIIIGGGHNNAYGNIKGTSLALNSKVNVINLDAHSDFRKEEGRHSGNGFTYAYSEGFLNAYYMFGLHENYTSQNVYNTLKKESKNIQFITFESLYVRQEQSFDDAFKQALAFVDRGPFGIEIDCDAIESIPSSAMTPTGVSANDARRFIHFFASAKNATYLHICEAAPVLAPKKLADQTSKLISYLITDFIRANVS